MPSKNYPNYNEREFDNHYEKRTSRSSINPENTKKSAVFNQYIYFLMIGGMLLIAGLGGGYYNGMQKNNINEYNRGYNAGILAGNETGYTEGYNLGFFDGNFTGFTNGTASGYSNGFNSGNASGYSSGNASGYDLGYSVGYSVGYGIGHSAGYNAGYSTGYSVGYSAGYGDGFSSGLSVNPAHVMTNITTIMPSASVMMNYSSTLNGLTTIDLTPNGSIVNVEQLTEYVIPFNISSGKLLKTIEIRCQITEGDYATLNCYIIPTKNFPTQLQTNWGNNLFRALVVQNNQSIPLQFTTYLENDSYYLCLESARGSSNFSFPLSNYNSSFIKYEYKNGTLNSTSRSLAIKFTYQDISFQSGTQQIMNVSSYTVKFSQGLSLTNPSVTLGVHDLLSLTTNTNLTLAYLNIKLNNDYSGSSLGSFTFGSNTINNFAISTYQFVTNSTTIITITNATLYTFPNFKPYIIITLLFNGSTIISHDYSAYWDYDLYTPIPQTTFNFRIGHSSANLFYGDPTTPTMVNFTETVLCFALVDEAVYETCVSNGWYDQLNSNVSMYRFVEFGRLMNYQYPNSYQMTFMDGYAVMLVQCDNFLVWGDTYGSGNGAYAAHVWNDNLASPSVLNGLVFGNQTTFTCTLEGFHYNDAIKDVDEVQYNMNGMILSDVVDPWVFFDPAFPIF